jgi:tRNA U34 2-thiouridine synthase MnmA/TrmU
MNCLKSVVCAVSGGVDSAVAAYLLKTNGYKVTGCFMRNWNLNDEDESKACTSNSDEQDAKYVCKKLEIPFISVDFSKNYWNQIFT